ncbi:hypothetical protein [Chromohalobacter sp. HP20-39]|uniref:hypothetical protein n=1 Tax=Chromohalobacter sp. HP20-39 TaxID=3079306 RepID=UPI00294B05D9|nr:hypothetical protein [Chromohalobacter sp. HP20-39]MDV6320550.1 hypothetical protein [Chromohalobacter sp. HP20-39]
MSEVYFHIGLPKSGSSAIQVYLNEKSSDLRSLGYVYPYDHGYPQQYRTSGGNAKKIREIARKGFPEGDVSSFKDEIAFFCGKFEKVIFSAEALSVIFKDSDPKLLKSLVPENVDIKIVIYLRNQIDKVVSDINQNIKNAYKTDYKINEKWFEFNDYEEQIRRWGHAFGYESLIIRGYDKKEFPEGDVVKDFCEHVGIPFLGYDTSSPINPSLGCQHLELMRQVNAIIKHEKDEKILKHYIKGFLWESSVANEAAKESESKQKKATYIERETLSMIAERLSGSNEAVYREFGASGLNLHEALKKYKVVEPSHDSRVFAEILVRMARDKKTTGVTSDRVVQEVKSAPMYNTHGNLLKKFCKQPLEYIRSLLKAAVLFLRK